MGAIIANDNSKGPFEPAHCHQNLYCLLTEAIGHGETSAMEIEHVALLRDRACILITKTYLYNFDPLKPHFHIVKLGFTGVTLFFLFC